MSLEVQLQDLNFTPVPLFPARTGALAGPLDFTAMRSLRPAAELTVRLQAPQLVRLGPRAVTLSPVRIDGTVAGVMVVAHLDSGKAFPGGGDLATVSGWLRTAIEQHMASQPVWTRHLAALNQALRAPAFDGSDRRLVAVFAEGLAVWHDIEVSGYVETAPGVFTRVVSLAGRATEVPPLVFPPQAVPAALQLTRMSRTLVDGDVDDAMVVTLTRSASSTWLLALSGEIDACDPPLLAAYVSALDNALALTIRAGSVRVALAVASDLAAVPLEDTRALARALYPLRRALGASTAHFSAPFAGAPPVVSAQSERAERWTQRSEPPSLLEPRTATRGRFALETELLDDSLWTPAEHEQARAVADVLEAWAERRDLTSPDSSNFAGAIDERVARTLERGVPITLFVFRCSPPPTATQATALVTQSRRFLREGDEAGALRNGDFVLLLPQTAPSQAAAVARRLKADLVRAAAATGIAIVGERFATRMPGQEAGGSLLQEARPNNDSGPVPA